MTERMPGSRWTAGKIVVLVISALVVGSCLVLKAITTNYGAYPPARVYGWVLGQLPPPGVTRLKVSGYGFGLNQQVFMRFAATDTVVKSFTSDPTARRMSPAESREEVADLGTRSDACGREARKVGWDKVPRSGELECYQLNCAGWYVTMAVNRESHRVFIAAIEH